MTDEEKPEEQSAVIQEEPVLFSDEYREKKLKPPYFMLALILLSFLMVFWKTYTRDEERTKDLQQSNKIYQELLMEKAKRVQGR